MLVFILLLVLLRIPYVQTQIARVVTSQLSKQTGAELHIDRVGINFTDRVVLKGIYAEDLQGDTLLYAGVIDIDIGLAGLFRRTIDVDRLMLEDVDTDSAPRGGTMIGDAIRKALSSMEPQADRDQAIVLITDGGDQDSFPAEAAQQAAQRNVRIITIGLGDVGEGARIPNRAEDGSLSFVQHEGQEIWSKMDETLLEEIATTTRGS